MDLAVNEELPILRKNRLSTGISDLDIILEGGYVNPGNILIVGPSGIEKAAIAYHFIASAPLNENGLIVCGNAPPEDIIIKASIRGIDLSRKNIIFIDCYNSTIGKNFEPTEKIKVVPGPSALNDLSLALNEVMKASAGKKIRVIFDTLSSFILYNPPDSIKKFLAVVEGRLKTANATVIYLVEEGVHDKQLLSLVQQGMDSTYILNEKSGRTVLNIPDIEVEIPLKIGLAGLSIV